MIMGWDGFANTRKGNLGKFKAAAKMVRDKAGSVDGLLERGALDCSDCALALEAATGRSCWDEDGWTAAEVRNLATNAVWPAEMPPEGAWSTLSAKAFLETCAEVGTGIHFSW
jgi:hypothetical protein